MCFEQTIVALRALILWVRNCSRAELQLVFPCLHYTNLESPTGHAMVRVTHFCDRCQFGTEAQCHSSEINSSHWKFSLKVSLWLEGKLWFCRVFVVDLYGVCSRTRACSCVLCCRLQLLDSFFCCIIGAVFGEVCVLIWSGGKAAVSVYLQLSGWGTRCVHVCRRERWRHARLLIFRALFFVLELSAFKQELLFLF